MRSHTTILGMTLLAANAAQGAVFPPNPIPDWASFKPEPTLAPSPDERGHIAATINRDQPVTISAPASALPSTLQTLVVSGTPKPSQTGIVVDSPFDEYYGSPPPSIPVFPPPGYEVASGEEFDDVVGELKEISNDLEKRKGKKPKMVPESLLKKALQEQALSNKRHAEEVKKFQAKIKGLETVEKKLQVKIKDLQMVEKVLQDKFVACESKLKHDA